MRPNSSDSQPPKATVALFGKVKHRGDFVRLQMRTAAAFAFEAWLTRAVERARGTLPPAPVRFVLDLASEAERAPLRLAGTFVPSQDAVGRPFPLVAFRELNDLLAESIWMALPTLFGSFFGRAEQLMEYERTAPLESLAMSLNHAGDLHPSRAPAAWEHGRANLDRQTVEEFAGRLFGQGKPGLAYALGTLQEACGRPPSELGLVLDVPVRCESDLVVWTALLDAALGPHAPMPSMFWATPVRRALLVLGPPPEAVLALLRDPHQRHPLRWPLETDDPPSAERAYHFLDPRVRRVLATNGTLRALRDAVSEGTHAR